jgi:hypothetical protein
MGAGGVSRLSHGYRRRMNGTKAAVQRSFFSSLCALKRSRPPPGIFHDAWRRLICGGVVQMEIVVDVSDEKHMPCSTDRAHQIS